MKVEPVAILYNMLLRTDMQIDWAIDAKGNKVHLPGIDFVKVYNGLNQQCGWLGETSTEVMGAIDLHLKGINIPTRETK